MTEHLEIDTQDWFWGPGGHRDDDDPALRVVVDGEHYLICGGQNDTGFRGHGGRRFDIEFFDGRTATTRNLWHQGTVPPKWRERYPDNARFVKPEQDLDAARQELAARVQPEADAEQDRADRADDVRDGAQ